MDFQIASILIGSISLIISLILLFISLLPFIRKWLISKAIINWNNFFNNYSILDPYLYNFVDDKILRNEQIIENLFNEIIIFFKHLNFFKLKNNKDKLVGKVKKMKNDEFIRMLNSEGWRKIYKCWKKLRKINKKINYIIKTFEKVRVLRIKIYKGAHLHHWDHKIRYLIKKWIITLSMEVSLESINFPKEKIDEEELNREDDTEDFKLKRLIISKSEKKEMKELKSKKFRILIALAHSEKGKKNHLIECKCYMYYFLLKFNKNNLLAETIFDKNDNEKELDLFKNCQIHKNTWKQYCSLISQLFSSEKINFNWATETKKNLNND